MGGEKWTDLVLSFFGKRRLGRWSLSYLGVKRERGGGGVSEGEWDGEKGEEGRLQTVSTYFPRRFGQFSLHRKSKTGRWIYA